MIDWYRGVLAQYGNTMQGVGWFTKKDWECAYRHAFKAFGKGRVWDVGCGIGLGRKILSTCDYYGCDMVRESVRLAGDGVWVGDHWSARGPFDYAVMGGIFNVGYVWERVCEVVSAVADTTEKGFVVSFGQGGRWPFSTFSMGHWARLCADIGSVKAYGPHGCSYVMVVTK